MSATRSGLGFDLHPLVDGRPLVLGGVSVPYERGLGGHSDADVLTHAVCEALLGALALGDLGRMFPDTDPRWKGVSSLEEALKPTLPPGLDDSPRAEETTARAAAPTARPHQ